MLNNYIELLVTDEFLASLATEPNPFEFLVHFVGDVHQPLHVFPPLFLSPLSLPTLASLSPSHPSIFPFSPLFAKGLPHIGGMGLRQRRQRSASRFFRKIDRASRCLGYWYLLLSSFLPLFPFLLTRSYFRTLMIHMYDCELQC
jgi:hypothetical protein